MPTLLDVAERSQKGPRMEEKAWDLGLFRKMAELAKEYELECPADPLWFNLDDGIPERAFRAAIDFIVQVGIYCVSTNRIAKFTEQEVLAAVRAQPSRLVVGEGRDQRVIEKRPLENRGEFNMLPGMHSPFSEEYAPLVVKNFAQIPEATYIEGFNFTTVDGREIFGPPMEAYAARRQVAWMREGVRKAGRPGMAIAYYPINTRAGALLAPLDPDAGLRRTDGMALSLLQDVKMEHDMLTAAIVCEEYGAFKLNATIGRFGSFVGGYEGAILEGIVSAILGWMVYRDNFGYVGIANAVPMAGKPIKVSRKGSWAVSVVCQALNRYTNYIYFGPQGMPRTMGPGGETCLLSSAGETVQAPINGCNLGRFRHSRAQMNAGQTPLEVDFKLEMYRAVMRTGLTRETAGPVMDGITRLLDGRMPEAPRQIAECYDLVNHQPSPEYRDTYLRVIEQMAALGLEFE